MSFRKGDKIRYHGPSAGLHNRDFDVLVGERFGAVKVRWGMRGLSFRAVFLTKVDA